MRKAEYARKRGVSPQAVANAANAGRLMVDERGRIDEAATASHVGTLADAKRREALARAQMAETKAAVMRGELVDRAEAVKAVRACARAERDALLLLPSRDAPAMAAALGVDEGRLRLALEDMLRGFLERPLPALK